MNYFREGYSCAQAVLLAFCDETGLTKEQAAMLAAPFGGGMGRLREVCGAFSAALMVMGLLEGVSSPNDEQAKADQYAEVQRWAKTFEEQNGSIICRDLLKDVPTTQGSSPQPRTEEYYAQRPCLAIVGRGAAMVEKFLEERK
ncbi:MAG: C_GCAxxG_C_C family protein [Oscillospiraceae bacterium]|nr:C_GCAxxG_C_C family protein [Oscillospiraceae bacterium]